MRKVFLRKELVNDALLSRQSWREAPWPWLVCFGMICRCALFLYFTCLWSAKFLLRAHLNFNMERTWAGPILCHGPRQIKTTPNSCAFLDDQIKMKDISHAEGNGRRGVNKTVILLYLHCFLSICTGESVNKLVLWTRFVKNVDCVSSHKIKATTI